MTKVKAKFSNVEGKVKLLSDPDPSKFYRWIVEFGVNAVWVADGFNLTDERALSMLAHDLSYANIGTELSARVLNSPRSTDIRLEQGESVEQKDIDRESEEDWPMTRNQIAAHAATVADHMSAEGMFGSRNTVQNAKLTERTRNMLELAMCKAAGVSWARKRKKKEE